LKSEQPNYYFKNNIARKSEKKEDKDSPFSKPHEAKLFQLPLTHYLRPTQPIT